MPNQIQPAPMTLGAAARYCRKRIPTLQKALEIGELVGEDCGNRWSIMPAACDDWLLLLGQRQAETRRPKPSLRMVRGK